MTPVKRVRKKAPPKGLSLADMSAPPTPNGKFLGDDDVRHNDDRAISPVSSTSSTSEKPLAQKIKTNGIHVKEESAPPSEETPSNRDGSGSVPPYSVGGVAPTSPSPVRDPHRSVLTDVLTRTSSNLNGLLMLLKTCDRSTPTTVGK